MWGSDITPEETPDEAGLGFAVRMDKGDFIGRAALASAREHGPARRMVCIVLDDPRAVTLGSEPVRVNGGVKSRVTSGGYGYAVERSIAYAYLPVELAEPDTEVEVEVFGDWVAGRVTPEPLYDPKGERIRA